MAGSKCCDPEYSSAALRHRIKFQSLSLAPNDSGGQTQTWTDFKTVWASVKPKIVREQFFAQRVEPRIDHTIRLRYTAGLTQDMRIVFGARIFEIKGMVIEDEVKDWITILAAERTGT